MPNWKHGEDTPQAEDPRMKLRKQYQELRKEIEVRLSYDFEEGVDFELFGAGYSGRSEILSPMEYQGALRVAGPHVSKLSAGEINDKFIKPVKEIATQRGFKTDIARPPAITHLFGVTHKDTDDDIQNRPFLYIWQSYGVVTASYEDQLEADRAGYPKSLFGKSYRRYKSEAHEIAAELTEDPHEFTNTARNVVSQIARTPEFKILREEIKVMLADGISGGKYIEVPVNVGDARPLVSVIAEGGHIKVSRLPSDITKAVEDQLIIIMGR